MPSGSWGVRVPEMWHVWESWMCLNGHVFGMWLHITRGLIRSKHGLSWCATREVPGEMREECVEVRHVWDDLASGCKKTPQKQAIWNKISMKYVGSMSNIFSLPYVRSRSKRCSVYATERKSALPREGVSQQIYTTWSCGVMEASFKS